MKADRPNANVVSRLRPDRRATGQGTRRAIRRALLIVGILAAAGAVVAPTRPVRGVCLLVIVVVVIGSAISWLAGSSGQLSQSGREMGEDSQNQSFGPPSS